MIVAMAELSTNPVDVIRRQLRPPKPVPPAVAAALAALVPLPARYAEIERDELAAIDAALAAGGSWEQIAEVMGVGSRQAARQYGQRLRRRVEQRRAAVPAPPLAGPGPDSAGGASPAARPNRNQPQRTSRRQRRK
jgi:hypothetical protein